MNLIEFTKIFHKIEVKERLFNLKSSNGEFYWDLIRHDTFYKIFNELNFDINSVSSNRRKKGRFKNIFIFLVNFIYDIYYLFSHKNIEYLFFINSRAKVGNKFVDTISNDYILNTNGGKFIIETNSSVLFSPYYKNTLKKLFSLFISKPINPGINLDKIFTKYFKMDFSLNSFIYNVLRNYNSEVVYYDFILKFLKPKKIFLVQNGIFKSIFYSASKNNVNVIELQHGAVNYLHPAYSYPTNIDKYLNNGIYLPTYIFSFSEYWFKDLQIPVKEIIPIGNNILANCSKPLILGKSITFISSKEYQAIIEFYISYYLNENPNFRINLKLHPNQFSEKSKLINKYKNIKNIKIISNEISVCSLLNDSIEIVVVSSTIAYEALQFGCKVSILTASPRSFDLYDLFGHPNVKLINPSNGFYKSSINKLSNQSIFFRNFNKDKFKEFLKK